MSGTVSGAGVELVFEERGSGPVVLLLHDMAADHRTLAPLAEELAAGAHVIAYARRGYGGSQAPEPYAGTTVQEQAEDAAALLRGLRARDVVLVGDGFGALIAIDLLRRHGDLVRAAVLGDPPLFAFAPDATRELAEQRGRIEEAVFAHGPQAGVAAWLAGRADATELERACAAHQAFFADYAGLATLPLTRGELRAIDVPLAVVTSPSSSAAVREAADAIAGLVPDVVRTTDGDLASAARGLLG